MLRPRLLLLAACLAALFPALAPAQLPPLIPRDVILGNPERARPRLSPDGKRLAWLAPDAKNVLQVWIKTVGSEDDKVITADKKRGIRQFWWAKDKRTLIYAQDLDGDENFHLYGVDLDNGNVRDLTPVQGARAFLVDLLPEFPDEALISTNIRNRQLFDVQRVNLKTGAMQLDTENPGDVSSWVSDAKFQVRAAVATLPNGGVEVRVRDDVKSPWRSFVKVGPDEILEAVVFSADGKSLVLKSSVGRDTAALVAKDLASGQEKVLAESAEVDADEVIVNPKSYVIEAVAFAPGRTTWKVLDPAVKGDYEAIAKLQDGDFTVVDRTEADDTWLVAFDSDTKPGRTYQWDRKTKTGKLLLNARPKLDAYQLATVKPVVITARDGLKMNGYLTLPAGVPPKNLPMVLNPHGGPWARDRWGFNGYTQLYANRGYAVLQVNFRGSTGYGKKHLYAGNRQWGLKMHDDLIDAVNWAVKEGVADPKRVGISGGSYGGYSALAGVTFTPEVFACAVDIVGPSNLKTLIGSIPPYWKTFRAIFDVRMGNVDDPKDAELIKAASPLFKADKIVRPLLIGQGANDPRVKQAESEQIVAAIEKSGGSCTYVLYPDEGHGFARPENRIDFTAREELFLATNLGGRHEPMPGDKIPGSTAVVKVVEGKKKP
ncbi:MAG: S9 family peptidase [Verrucomicrobia bacterium]|nr:S9 family peptidase [Verrucomicrobiota bacterium]